MQTSDEMKQIMRAALDDLKNQALAEMSNSDRRLVSIAQRPSEDEVRQRIAALRQQWLAWPLAQAVLGCLTLLIVFGLGIKASFFGELLGEGMAFVAIAGLAIIPFPVAQLIARSRDTQPGMNPAVKELQRIR